MELNKKTILPIIGIFLVIAVLLLLQQKENNAISIGWLTSVTTEGQHVLVMKNTDVLKNNDLKAEFTGFSYAPPLSEAALAGKFDVAFMADLPALKLIEKDPDWVIVARHSNLRGAIIVPKNSQIKSPQDLKGKTIFSPFGSAIHIQLMQKFRELGLNEKKDFEIKNLDILEQAPIIEKGTDDSWGTVDALISWDPSIALFEKTGKARILMKDDVIMVALMRKSFIQKNPESAKRFMKAFKEAYLFYAQNQKIADDWYVKESRINISSDILEVSTGYEPNLNAKTLGEIKIALTDDEIKKIQSFADYAFESGVLTKKHELKSEINFELMKT